MAPCYGAHLEQLGHTNSVFMLCKSLKQSWPDQSYAGRLSSLMPSDWLTRCTRVAQSQLAIMLQYERTSVFESRFGTWTQSQFGPNLVEGQFGKMPGTMQEHNMS